MQKLVHVTAKWILLSLSLVFVLFSVPGCTLPDLFGHNYHGKNMPLHLVITSANQTPVKGFSAKDLTYDFNNGAPTFAPGYIISGPPDYLKVVLRKVSVNTDHGISTVWEGWQEITLDGTGEIVLDNLTGLPLDHITQVNLTLEKWGKIKGTLSGNFSDVTDGVTVNTKEAYKYDAGDHTGGASAENGLYTAFQGGEAEEMEISLSGDSALTIQTPLDFTPNELETPTLTFLFDLSRVLRFYDGGNTNEHGGVNPSDPGDHAYFFCHSVFSNSVATFFGDVGQIQGYETLYACHRDGNLEGVTGWMTLIFNPDGEFISGILIGDDDNALTIAKGQIQEYVEGDYFTYGIDDHTSTFNVYGFGQSASIGDSTVPLTWEGYTPTVNFDDPENEAIFILRLKTPNY